MIDYEATFVNTDGALFPDTLAVNVSAPGAGDGTEFVAAMVNDIWGRAQSLLDYAGLSPDGVQEVPGTAQILEAIGMGFGVGPGVGVIYWKNDTPAAWGDRVLLLQGQVVLIADYPLLVAATYCGDGNNPTAPAFYKTSDAGGTTRSTAGNYFVLPDARGLSLKNIGNATVNTRTKTGPAKLGEMQEDQFQAWQSGLTQSAKEFYGASVTDTEKLLDASVSANHSWISYNTTYQGAARKIIAKSDGTNGTPRTGTATRDSSMGTNYGITY